MHIAVGWITPQRASLCMWFCLSLDSFRRVLPLWLSGKESAHSAAATEDAGSISGLERSPGGGNGKSLPYSCLGNPLDRVAWWATVQGVSKELDTTEQLSMSERADPQHTFRLGTSKLKINECFGG